MKQIVFFVLVGVVAGYPPYQQSQAPDETLVDSLAPDFTLTNELGEEVSLSDYRGKLVFLNFWATWCDGCVKEMPQMAELNTILADRPFQMLTVSVNTSWTPVLDFYKSTDIRAPTLLDPGQHARMDYRVFGFPETFLIDGDGRIVRKYIGWRDWTLPEVFEEIEEHVRRVEGRGYLH